VFVHAVVIAGDGAGADVDLLAHGAVADVGEVVDLAAVVHLAVLDLDEVADMHRLRQLGAGAEAGERSDAAIRADLGFLEQAERGDARVRRDARIAQHAVGADPDVVAQRHFAFENAVDVDFHVAPASQFAAHVEALGVGQAYSLFQQALRLLVLVQPFQVGELCRAVDAQHFPVVARLAGVDLHAFRHCHADYVGEVILVLGIVVGELRQPVLEARGRQRHHAGVDLADGVLGGAGILVFDYRGDVAVRVADDAAIAGRIGQFDREQRAALAGGGLQQGFQRGLLDQRHVAVEHQRQAAGVEVGRGLLQSVAGAELGFLPDPGDGGVVDDLRHGFPAVAVDHHDFRRRQAARGVQHMLQQRQAGQPVQHFGQLGNHARAFAGSEDDDVEGKRHIRREGGSLRWFCQIIPNNFRLHSR